MVLASLARVEGDFAGARALLEEGLALTEAVGDQYGVGQIRIALGDLAVAAGDAGAAHAHYARAARAVGAMGFNKVGPQALAGLVGLAMQRRDPARALRIVSATAVLVAAAGVMPLPAVQAQLAELRAAADHALSAEERAAAWAAGQTMTLEEALAAPTEANPAR